MKIKNNIIKIKRHKNKGSYIFSTKRNNWKKIRKEFKNKGQENG